MNNTLIQKVNRVLKKNYTILESINKSGKTKVARSKLLQEGFDFNYFTSIYKTQKGGVYHYCYNQGYLALSDDLYLLIKKEE